MRAGNAVKLKVADKVWIATALLHQGRPSQEDFSVKEILARVTEESLTATVRPGVYVHVLQHCVANRKPNPARYRMLYETRPGRRRLFRTGDSYHPDREGGRILPNSSEIPSEFLPLLGWYRDWCSAAVRAAPQSDPLLVLAGSGKELWAEEHADEYINRLREDRE